MIQGHGLDPKRRLFLQTSASTTTQDGLNQANKSNTSTKYPVFSDYEKTRMARMICSYWFRTLTFQGHSDNVSFQCLVSIISMHFMPELQWNNRYVNDPHDVKLFCKKHSSYSFISCRSKNILSADSMSTVRWQMTLTDNFNEARGTLRDFRMGFFDSEYLNQWDIEDKDMRTPLGKDVGTFAFAVSEERWPVCWRNGERKHFDEFAHPFPSLDVKWSSSPSIFSIGDRFELRFNFHKGECHAYFNEDLVGLVTSKIPNEVYFATSLFWNIASFETTLFEIIYRKDF